jgi:acyl-coenzyme A synthetase/AMP-(fatty) acid ligase
MASGIEIAAFGVVAGGREFGFADLTAAAHGVDSSQVRSVAISLPDGPLTAAALLWVRRAGLNAVLVHADLHRTEAEALAQRMGCSHLLSGGADGKDLWLTLTACQTDSLCRGDSRCSLGLLTSGTTGIPKLVTRDWQVLERSVARGVQLQEARWMSLYPLTRFAGFNTLLHALCNEATLIVPRALQPSAILEDLSETSPTHISGTPTMWRNLLMTMPPGSRCLSSLRQITLGGEVVDQPILNALKAAAPQARLTHIYASTELGVCAAVSDGQAGFPAEWLKGNSKRVKLRLRGDELWVKRTGCSLDHQRESSEEWVATGDLAEIDGGRVYFKGRRSDILNVGGAKVAPAEVEECISEVPGVLGARVLGRQSSIAGTVIAAEIIGQAGVDEKSLRATIMKHCRACLPSYAVPRIVAFVRTLPISASGKILRTDSEKTNA